MVLDDDIMDLEEHAAMLQNKALIQNNVVSKRKEQLKHWENSEMNKLCPRRQIQQTKVKFQDRDIFLSACQSGDEEEVEGLLQKGSDINVSSIDGVTALHQAVIDGNADIVRFLIEHDADINAQDNEGWTPLHAAVCCGNLNITKFLYEHGADLSCVNSDKELPIDLAENDEIRVFLEKEMLRTGVDEQKAREREFNVMLDDCSRWIQSGKYVDAPHPRTGATALHVAASKGYNKLIGMLLRAGANINAQDFEGWTPLHAAAHWGERDACRILMENGASLEAVTHSGHSVLAVADKSIEEYLNELKEKFNELRSGALLQHHQQSNGILQDASNLATDPEKELFAVNGGDRIVTNQPGLHGTEKLQSAAIRRISSGDKLATKRKEMRESDENLLLATKRSSPAPPVPAERHSLMRREETNGRAGANNEVGQALDFAKMEDKSARPTEDEDEEYEDEEEVEDESEWTEVTATPSSSTAAPAAAAASAATVASDTDNTNKASSFTDRIVNQRDPYSSNTFRRENPETTTSHAGKVEGIKFPQLEAQKVNGPLPSAAPTPICGSSSAASVAETTASSSSSSGKHREREEKTTATSGSTKEEGSTSSSSSTRESSHSASPSYSTDRSNTGSGVSSIQTSSRSVTPKDCSSSLYSSDQSIQCVVRVGQPASNSQQKSLSSTSSTTTNNSNKAHSTKTNHKSAVLRAAEETVKRLRKQLPNVQTGVDRAKSQSVDFGKPSPLLDSPLKSPPASAPLVQSARLFWNSIGNNGNNPPTAGQQQNHPLGSTQLHQQQFHRSRQRFANSTNSFDSDSPFAIVAGEQKSSEKLFKRGDSLKTGMGLSATSSFQSQNGHRRQHQKQAPPPPVERLTKMTKPEDFLFGSSTATIQTGTTSMPPPAAPLAAITSASNTPSESQNSSVTHSPSPSPLINSPFVTIRKQSWQQSTPPTQPTSQKESESERKAKSKLKRSTRRSTQGVTLEQMGEANRMQTQLNHGRNESHKLSEDRIQQVNAKFNQMMEMQKVPRDPPQELHHQLQPPSSPGCSSASSSSAYITASNSRHAAAAAVSQHQASTAQPKDDPPAVPIVNFSSTALLIDELNKYKQLYEQERDECERLRLQVQELSADSRAKASNVLRGVGWRPGATLIQRTELPSGITYSTVTRSISRPLSDEKLATRLNADEKQGYEKRISELENELENLRELRVKNDLLKKENEALVRILARNTRNNYLTSEQRNPDRTDSAMKT